MRAPPWLLFAAAPLGVVLVGAAMASTTAAPTSPRIVPHQSPDKDEDPFALHAPDGSVHVFWFSNRMRSGALHSDIVCATYKGGKFGDLRDVSGDLPGMDRDVYPSAVLGQDGTIHVAWFRFHDGSIPATQFPPSSVMYRTISPSGELGPAERVTNAIGATLHGDWVPSIALDRGTPVIAFASPTRGATNVWRIHWTRRGARGWTRPIAIKGANTPGTHNNLPALLGIGDGLVLAWNRHPRTGSLLAWEHLDNEVWFMKYRRGAWGRPARVGRNPTKQAPNVFPNFFEDHAGRWLLYWQHHEAGRDWLQAVPVVRATSSPTDLPMRFSGYSPRVARLKAGGQYVAFWVHQGTSDVDLDIAYRHFRWGL